MRICIAPIFSRCGLLYAYFPSRIAFPQLGGKKSGEAITKTADIGGYGHD